MAGSRGKPCCVVTGGTGFVGLRLVEMLQDRSAFSKIISFDIRDLPEEDAQPIEEQTRKGKPEVVFVTGDLSKLDDLLGAMRAPVIASGEHVACVFHIAALVGPYHVFEMYRKVNYEGTLNVIEACNRVGCNKVVMSSSPSTRFDGNDIRGKTVDELTFPEHYTHAYAETKAMGEQAMMAACHDDPGGKNSFYSVAVAPHQVYGPRDMLFLHNFLLNARKLRILGAGRNKISMTHVDNYCEGLIKGYEALYSGSPALGNFYIVTDGEARNFWDTINHAFVSLGYADLHSKVAVPWWVIVPIAHATQLVGRLLGRRFKLNPFAVRMMMIDRWFDIGKAERDLKYSPVVDFETGWSDTIDWFKANWLPRFDPGVTRLA